MIRIVRPYDDECKLCEAFKPIMTTKKFREDGEIVDQYAQVECGNSWICGQIRKVISRGNQAEERESEP